MMWVQLATAIILPNTQRGCYCDWHVGDNAIGTNVSWPVQGAQASVVTAQFAVSARAADARTAVVAAHVQSVHVSLLLVAVATRCWKPTALR